MRRYRDFRRGARRERGLPARPLAAIRASPTIEQKAAEMPAFPACQRDQNHRGELIIPRIGRRRGVLRACVGVSWRASGVSRRGWAFSWRFLAGSRRLGAFSGVSWRTRASLGVPPVRRRLRHIIEFMAFSARCRVGDRPLSGAVAIVHREYDGDGPGMEEGSDLDTGPRCRPRAGFAREGHLRWASGWRRKPASRCQRTTQGYQYAIFRDAGQSAAASPGSIVTSAIDPAKAARQLTLSETQLGEAFPL
jgi:hypothetical protein